MAEQAKTLQSTLIELECENPVKDTEAYKYKYAQLAQVAKIITQACKEVGLRWRQGVKRYAKDDFTLCTWVFDKNEEKLLDERPFVEYPKPQDQGSGETYTRRYALLCAFGLAPEDDDGAAAQKVITPKKAAKQAPANNKRAKMIERIKKYENDCTSNGVLAGSLKDWLVAKFETCEINKLDDAALTEYGKHLGQLVKDSAHLPR